MPENHPNERGDRHTEKSKYTEWTTSFIICSLRASTKLSTEVHTHTFANAKRTVSSCEVTFRLFLSCFGFFVSQDGRHQDIRIYNYRANAFCNQMNFRHAKSMTMLWKKNVTAISRSDSISTVDKCNLHCSCLWFDKSAHFSLWTTAHCHGHYIGLMVLPSTMAIEWISSGQIDYPRRCCVRLCATAKISWFFNNFTIFATVQPMWRNRNKSYCRPITKHCYPWNNVVRIFCQQPKMHPVNIHRR